MVQIKFAYMHVFLHFKSFCLVLFKLILASKLSDLYSNLKIGLQITSKQALRVEMRQKKQTNAINKI